MNHTCFRDIHHRGVDRAAAHRTCPACPDLAAEARWIADALAADSQAQLEERITRLQAIRRARTQEV